MAQLALSVAGAVVGSFFGAPQIGWMAGSLLGAAITPGPKTYGPKLNDLKVMGTEYGQVIPWVAGSPRIAGQIVWASSKRETAHEESQGKGDGPSYTSYTYDCDLLILLSENQIAGISRVWSNGELVWDGNNLKVGVWADMRVYTGAADQMPDPTYEAAVGSGNAPAYRGRGYVVIQGLQLGGGGNLPNLTFELLGRDGLHVIGATGTPATIATIPDTRYLGVGMFVDSENNIWVSHPDWDAGGGNRESYTQYKYSSSGVLLSSSQYSVPLLYPSGSPGNMNCVSDVGPVFVHYWNSSFGSPYTLAVYINGSKVFEHKAQTYGFPWNATGEFYGNVNAVAFYATEGVYLPANYSGRPVVALLNTVSTYVLSPSLDAGIDTNYSGVMVVGDKVCVIRGSYPQKIHRFNRGTLSYIDTIDPPNIGNNGLTDLDLVQSDVGLLIVKSYFTKNVAAYHNGAWVTFNTDFNGGSFAKWQLSCARLPYVFTMGAGSDIYSSYSNVSWGADKTEDLSNVLDDLMLRSGYTIPDFDRSAIGSDLVRGFAIGQNSNSRGALEMLQQAYFFECSKSDKLYIKPRSMTPVATLPFNVLGVSDNQDGDDDPLALIVGNELELPAQISLSYPNVSNDYQTGTEFSDRLLSGQESTQAAQMALGMLPAEAKGVVDALLMDQMASLTRTTIKLPLRYAFVEPGDVVTATNNDGRTYRLRVQSKKDSLTLIELECVLDDVGALDSASITDTGYVDTTTVIPVAPTLFDALDIPILRDADDAPGYYVAVTPNKTNATDEWKGALVAHSWDGVSYEQLYTSTQACVMGTCSTTLPNWTGGNVFDEASTLTVTVKGGELASSTRAAMLLDDTVNAMLVGSEVIRFRNATLVTAGTYVLSGLLRGQRGTEWAMGGHVASESCILLNGSLRRVVSQTNEIGLVRDVKAVTFGQFLSAGVAESFTDTGIALKPFAPANPRALASGADMSVTWQRRTRKSYLYGGATPTVPLGEDTESYRVRVFAGATLKRTETTTTPAFTYTAAMLTADGFTAGQAVTFEISQVSSIVGAGYPSTVQGTAP